MKQRNNNGSIKEMKVTVEDIAHLSGVSKATVSRVLNNKAEGVGSETRLRVQKIINDVNYNTDGSLSSRFTWRTKSIGLILPDISNPFFSELAKAVENCAREKDYSVILGDTDFSEANEAKCISSFVAKKVDGIILIPTGSKCRDEHGLPEKYKIPCLLLDRNLQGMNCCAGVFFDNEYAAFSSCELLIKSGSKRIAFISGPEDFTTSKERLNGYFGALQQYEIPYDSQLIKYGSYTVESGYNAVIELERAGIKYSAILVANDMMALGAIKALKELSYKIPNEIEIIGFDNISFSQYCDPPLTTIQQPTIELGRKATEILLNAIDGRRYENKIIRLQPKLLIRKTTK